MSTAESSDSFWRESLLRFVDSVRQIEPARTGTTIAHQNTTAIWLSCNYRSFLFSNELQSMYNLACWINHLSPERKTEFALTSRANQEHIMTHCIGKTGLVGHRSAMGAVVLCGLALCLSGCTMGTINLSGPDTSAATVSGISGKVIGGQQPVAGSLVKLYQVGTTGYGTGATAISGASTYTDTNGNFAIPSYTCPNGSALTYVVATGGNPGNAKSRQLYQHWCHRNPGRLRGHVHRRQQLCRQQHRGINRHHQLQLDLPQRHYADHLRRRLGQLHLQHCGYQRQQPRSRHLRHLRPRLRQRFRQHFHPVGCRHRQMQRRLLAGREYQ